MSTNRKPRGDRAAASAAPQRGGRGAPSRKFYTPGGSPFRHAVERRSAPALVWLHRAPRWIIPVAVLILLLVGAAAPRPVGALAFLILAAGLSWLCFLSWPALRPHSRLLRMVAVAIILAVAIGRGTGILP
ncbi:MAG: hypothetical protein GEV03_27260 [Streptosporangiales bacterium]|nr:hypothetical protein [Streptosporangiales bacterium]